MGRNFGSGGKNCRRYKKDDGQENERELLFKEDSQVYARIEKVFGSGRFSARVLDNDGSPNKQKVRLAIIRGSMRSMRKKVHIVLNDIILLSLREFQDDKADIIHKYTSDEACKLIEYGELPKDALVDLNGDVDDEDDFFEFAEDDEDGHDDSNLKSKAETLDIDSI
ncbi:nucleic acid-binding protein [Whalleya microplaca]|nr:nucleic acid-binding protein [Whalleya microplaca]